MQRIIDDLAILDDTMEEIALTIADYGLYIETLSTGAKESKKTPEDFIEGIQESLRKAQKILMEQKFIRVGNKKIDRKAAVNKYKELF